MKRMNPGATQSRRRFLWVVFVLAVTLTLLTGIAWAGGGGGFAVREVLAGGGGQSQAGRYALTGIVGQAVIGASGARPYGLCSGFWCGMIYYDIYLPLIRR
jgi:hypothetical protein